MLSSREVVRRAILFQTPDRLPQEFPGDAANDFFWLGMSPSPDDRPSQGRDEWGAVWENLGVAAMGEVKEYPLLDWADFDRLPIPDITLPSRWVNLDGARERAGDKFIITHGLSIYERIHMIRGLENTWMDIYEYPDELIHLIDILVDMNLYAIKRYAEAGADGYIFNDDWGLQNRLMISPEKWRAIWKPAYARIFSAVHEAGMLSFLHSCGYIVDILDDLIEIGLDVIHMDQQENMGLELLGERFGGRITFFSPVDIQKGMQRSLPEVRDYARQMAQHLARPAGGLLPRFYRDYHSAGHRWEAIEAMVEEFQQISREMYGACGPAMSREG